MKKFLSKNNVILFAIAFVVTIATALVCSLCGVGRITMLFVAPTIGAFSVTGVGAIYEAKGKSFTESPDAGLMVTEIFGA